MDSYDQLFLLYRQEVTAVDLGGTIELSHQVTGIIEVEWTRERWIAPGKQLLPHFKVCSIKKKKKKKMQSQIFLNVKSFPEVSFIQW